MPFRVAFGTVLVILCIVAWLTEPDPDVDWKSPPMDRWARFKRWWRLND